MADKNDSQKIEKGYQVWKKLVLVYITLQSYYFVDVADAADPQWRTWEERKMSLLYQISHKHLFVTHFLQRTSFCLKLNVRDNKLNGRKTTSFTVGSSNNALADHYSALIITFKKFIVANAKCKSQRWRTARGSQMLSGERYASERVKQMWIIAHRGSIV